MVSTNLSVQIADDNEKFKFTNHSYRPTTVYHLARVGVKENQLTKITALGNVSPIKTYSQQVIKKMKKNENNELSEFSVSTSRYVVTGELKNFDWFSHKFR